MCVLNLWAWHFSCWEICFLHVLHLSIILSFVTSCFITFMHLYGFLVPPLIILDYLYVSRVKLSSFLYPLSIMTKKGGEIVENMWFLFKILHVRGRNTCPCKGEICFILLGGVLTSFFLYTGLVTLFTYIVLIYIYMWWCMSSSPTSTCVVSFLSLYTCFFLYAIYYFCFIQRCLDEFCLKYFRNTGCQSLLVINSLLAKFFKSLC